MDHTNNSNNNSNNNNNNNMLSNSLFSEKPIINLAKNLFVEIACETGDLEAFKCLIENYEVDISQNNNEYLSIASSSNSIKIIDYILLHNQFVTSNSLYKTFMLTIKNNYHTITLLFLMNDQIMEYLDMEYESFYEIVMKKALKYNNNYVIDNLLYNDKFIITAHFIKYIFAYYPENSKTINLLLNSEKMVLIVEGLKEIETFLESIYNKSKYRYLYEFPEYLEKKFDKNMRDKNMRDFVKYITVLGIIYYYASCFN